MTREIPEDILRVSRDLARSYLHIRRRLFLLMKVKAINANVCRMYFRNFHNQADNSFRVPSAALFNMTSA